MSKKRDRHEVITRAGEHKTRRGGHFTEEDVQALMDGTHSLCATWDAEDKRAAEQRAHQAAQRERDRKNKPYDPNEGIPIDPLRGTNKPDALFPPNGVRRVHDWDRGWVWQEHAGMK